MRQWLSEIFLDQRKNVNQSNKLRVYRTFKTKYEDEVNLGEIANTKLQIELGARNRIREGIKDLRWNQKIEFAKPAS